ncbi:hypothetical protein NPIL_247001, partial [Nephila pilipes]
MKTCEAKGGSGSGGFKDTLQ